MERTLESELLDQLPADDPGAIRSRRDLQRLNRIMGNAGWLAGTLRLALHGPPESIMEIGAGDGTLLLQVCRRSAGRESASPRTAILLDRLNVPSAATRSEFDRLRWRAEVIVADIFEWLRGPTDFKVDVIIANLFLHHFTNQQLSEMFALTAARTNLFAAVEPRRCSHGLFFSKLVGAIGCNRVTRHDAPVSVRAGFAGNELSELWPQGSGWIRREASAGLFGHLFVASRKE